MKLEVTCCLSTSGRIKFAVQNVFFPLGFHQFMIQQNKLCWRAAVKFKFNDTITAAVLLT